MKKNLLSIVFLTIAFGVSAQAQQLTGNPQDHLPANITRITPFGERADFSHDGKFMAFQMARSTDLAGIGFGIFLMKLKN